VPESNEQIASKPVTADELLTLFETLLAA